MILLLATLFLCAVMTLAWLVQRRLRNAGWVDAFWTFGLGISGAGVALMAGTGQRRFVVAALIGVWALRLGWHIVARSRGAPEDSRYGHFRAEWGAAFERRMFVFLQIQAGAAVLLLVPVLLAAASPRPLGWIDALAIAVALVAFAGEGIADRQLQAFRDDPRNHGRVCDHGLWAWSRHPNYVFEWLHWWAYPVFAIGTGWAFLALIGPAFMYWLLVHVSGIPPLEAQMLRSRGEAYRAYQQRVSAFLPLPKGLFR
jgi:steroid 5-alpha reductase family enzyme